MPLCYCCANIDFEAIRNGQSHAHLSDATKLLASSGSCDLCKLIILSVLQHSFVTIHDRVSYWLPEPITFRRPAVYLDDSEDEISVQLSSPLIDIEIVIPVSGGEDIIRLGVRCEAGIRT
jgi:hypothetical protein